MQKRRLFLLVGLMGLPACPAGGTGSDTHATTSDPGGDTSTSGEVTSTEGTSGTGGTEGGVTTSAGTGDTDGTSDTGDTGDTPPGGACPIDQFPAEQQIVFEDGAPSISDDTVWTKDNLYIVKTELEVHALLTIEAGTTVCFVNDLLNDDGSLQIAPLDAGGLRIQGTADERVTLTALDPAEGWNGVIVNGDATVIDIAYTDILHASRLDLFKNHFSYGALRIRGVEDTLNTPARLHHVTISGVKRGGALWLEGPAGLTADSVVRVEAFDLDTDDLGDVDAAVLVSLQSASSLAPGMISISEDVPEPLRGIEPLPTSLLDDATLHALDVPYLARRGFFVVSTSLSEKRSLTIEAGVEVRLGASALIQVGSESHYPGDLIVDGTADKPVRFVYSPFPDDYVDQWGGLFFVTYDPAVSRVSHAVLAKTGGNAVAHVNDACKVNSQGAIVMSASALKSDWPGIVIEHTTIDGAASHGIVAECSLGCIDPATDYMDPALGNMFIDIAGQPQLLATCP